MTLVREVWGPMAEIENPSQIFWPYECEISFVIFWLKALFVHLPFRLWRRTLCAPRAAEKRIASSLFSLHLVCPTFRFDIVFIVCISYHCSLCSIRGNKCLELSQCGVRFTLFLINTFGYFHWVHKCFFVLTVESGNFEGSRSTVVGPWSIYIILRAGSKVYGIDLSSIVSLRAL